MSGTPFGFGPRGGSDDPGDDGPGSGGTGGPGGLGGSGEGGAGGADPFGFGALGDPQAMAAAFAQIGQLLSWKGGPVNWDLARDTARAAVAGSDPSPSLGDRAVVEQALRLADLWLDDVTALPAASGRLEAWSRAEWVERSLPTWRALVEPVADKVAAAMGAAVADATGGGLEGLGGMPGLPGGGFPGLPGMGMPGMGMPGMPGMGVPGGPGGMSPEALQEQLGGLVKAMTASMFGAQVGQALGALAAEVVGSTDVGLPLAEPGRAALLPSGVKAFGEGLEVPEDEVRVYLALREAAHQRLYASAPWLRSRLAAQVEAYARGITVDMAAIEAAVAQLDPTDPAAVQEAMGNGLFEPEPTAEQREALDRLETLLALVEGWVDAVTAAAAGPHLKHDAALRETVRRRRASGGPAEQTFASLVGLELRPRRLREAATLWQAVTAARGAAGRDALWGHPDLLPSAADLDDPTAFASDGGGDFDVESLLATEQSAAARDESADEAADEAGPAAPGGDGGSDSRPGSSDGTGPGPDGGAGPAGPGSGPGGRG